MNSELICLIIGAIHEKMTSINSHLATLKRCAELIPSNKREECEKVYKQVLEHLNKVLTAYESLRDGVKVDEFEELDDWYEHGYYDEYYYALRIFNEYL